MLGGADGVQPPAPPTPRFELEVTAGDDATPLVATVGLDGAAAGQTDLAGRLTILWREAWPVWGDASCAP